MDKNAFGISKAIPTTKMVGITPRKLSKDSMSAMKTRSTKKLRKIGYLKNIVPGKF